MALREWPVEDSVTLVVTEATGLYWQPMWYGKAIFAVAHSIVVVDYRVAALPLLLVGRLVLLLRPHGPSP